MERFPTGSTSKISELDFQWKSHRSRSVAFPFVFAVFCICVKQHLRKQNVSLSLGESVVAAVRSCKVGGPPTHDAAEEGGREGGAVHHLVQTNWTVSRWQEPTRTRTHSSHQQRGARLFHVIVIMIICYYYFYTFTSFPFISKKKKKAAKHISVTHD